MAGVGKPVKKDFRTGVLDRRQKKSPPGERGTKPLARQTSRKGQTNRVVFPYDLARIGEGQRKDFRQNVWSCYVRSPFDDADTKKNRGSQPRPAVFDLVQPSKKE